MRLCGSAELMHAWSLSPAQSYDDSLHACIANALKHEALQRLVHINVSQANRSKVVHISTLNHLT